jgi:DegV family protein with EDD domain
MEVLRVMAVRILTDSASDLTASQAEEWGIQVLSFPVLVDTVSYDNCDMSPDFFVQAEKPGAVLSTAQITPPEFAKIFQEATETGDEIIGIFISSKLSGTFNSAMIAKDTLSNDRIHLVDSLCATIAEGGLVLEAAKLLRSGRTAAEVAQWAKVTTAKMRLYGCIHSLDYLRRGGRLSPTSAIFGNILGIKPIITFQDGGVVLTAKARGYKKAVDWMLDDVLLHAPDPNDKTVYLGHCLNEENLRLLREALKRRFRVREFVTMPIGPVVAAHIGPGAVGFFIAE